MQPKPRPQVYVDHIHAPLVSVREQAEVVVARLRELGEASFAALTEDAPDTLTVVARFLALLELYRERRGRCSTRRRRWGSCWCAGPARGGRTAAAGHR